MSSYRLFTMFGVIVGFEKPYVRMLTHILLHYTAKEQKIFNAEQFRSMYGLHFPFKPYSKLN